MTFEQRLHAYYSGETELIQLAHSAAATDNLASQEFATAVLYEIALSLDTFFDIVSTELDYRRAEEGRR